MQTKEVRTISNLTLTFLVLFLPKHPLHGTNSLSCRPEDGREPKAPSLHSNRVDEEIHQCPVTDAETKEYTEVSPFVAWFDV